MKVRIDPHLTRFEIIRQLRDLLVAYDELKVSGDIQDENYSFTDYLYSQSLDPVKRFLILCVPEDSLGSDTDHEQMITYWTEKFKTLRGTLDIFKALDELSNVLRLKIGHGEPGDLDYVPPYIYNVRSLEVNFTEVETTDMNLFTRAASEFFKSLLYFQDLRDTYQSLKLNLTSDIIINLSAGSRYYTSFTATEDEI